MKKQRFVALALALALCISVFTVSSGAFRGSGVQVIAEEVEIVKSGLVGRKLCFSDADFKSALAIAEFGTVRITELPSSNDGMLLLAGRRVREGQEIKRRNIAAMVFVPASKDVAEASFKFEIDGGCEHTYRIKFLENINYAPETRAGGEAALSLVTQREIGVYGKMSGSDPEGDEITYMVVAYPESGRLTVSKDGSYCYTPEGGYIGNDAFTYVVRDEYGNYSEPETVSVKVIERMSEVVYEDMKGREEYNASVAMTAMGVMSGTTIGDSCYFAPDVSVTRAEFVAMVMKAAGKRASVGVTVFEDNADIPKALLGYVAAAASLGIVNGEIENSRLVFKPNEIITVWEAADIMSRLVGIRNDEESGYLNIENVPVWARPSLSAMVTLGVIDEGTTDYTKELRRAAAAECIYRMVNNC